MPNKKEGALSYKSLFMKCAEKGVQQEHKNDINRMLSRRPRLRGGLKQQA